MKYNIYYPLIPNMGDLLNKDMLESLFGISVTRANSSNFNILAIGSCLKFLLYSDNKITHLKQKIESHFNSHPIYVWGTGFASYNSGDDNEIRFTNYHILSLRGNLSKVRMEKIIGSDLDIPLGDGGLLADRWIGAAPTKKYRLGIIPHFREKDYPLLGEISKFYPDSTIIDLGEPPIEVVKKIASCELILSSSLHGLIISDSFHIPNMHISLFPFGERIRSDGFKFDDYYSSYGLKDSPINMDNRSEWPTMSYIHDSYQIDINDVERIKDQIYNVFPQ